MHAHIPRFGLGQLNDLKIVRYTYPKRVVSTRKAPSEESIVVASTMTNAGPINVKSNPGNYDHVDVGGRHRIGGRLRDAIAIGSEFVLRYPRREVHCYLRPTHRKHYGPAALGKRS